MCKCVCVLYHSKFRVSKNFSLFLKVSYVYQGYIYLIKNTIKKLFYFKMQFILVMVKLNFHQPLFSHMILLKSRNMYYYYYYQCLNFFIFLWKLIHFFSVFLYYINTSLQICFEWFIPLILLHLPTNPKANVPTISTHTRFLNNIIQVTWFILGF